jgi:heme-degrading monooxygenase HmoA
MFVVTFRSRLAPGHDATEYGARALRMRELVESIPGFRSFRAYTSDDGERLALIEFDSEEGLRAWREHPEHREAQRMGRRTYYTEYHLQVCELLRESHKAPAE